MAPEIQVGDVCLDLAQGRPVHVIEDVQQTAAEWSGDNGYELEENYGNSRLGTGPNDRVYEVVYCSSIKSEPSKSYAMPESRLVRVETEAADDGRVVADRVRVDVLERVIDSMLQNENIDDEEIVPTMMLAEIDRGLYDEARELAEVEKVIGGDDGDG